MTDSVMWLGATIFATLIMSFFSCEEMACVSCNRLRVALAAQTSSNARLLMGLLATPSRLFITTLIGVNIALMVSSECARSLFSSLGLDPDLSPFVHIPFVLIFGELVPMFAARLFPMHMALMGCPFLWASAQLLRPIFPLFEGILLLAERFVPRAETAEKAISQEELQRTIEEAGLAGQHESYDALISNVFGLRAKTIAQLMRPLEVRQALSGSVHAKDAMRFFKEWDAAAIPIYHRAVEKIIGLLYPQDLLHCRGNKRLSNLAHAPLYISEDTSALLALPELARDVHATAVVINQKGHAVGLITLSEIIAELYSPLPIANGSSIGSADMRSSDSRSSTGALYTWLEKTFPATTSIDAFNSEYGTSIASEGCHTFAELIEKRLGRHPNVGDSIACKDIQIVVREATLLAPKTILIRTLRP